MLLLFLVLHVRVSFALLLSAENRLSTRNITCKHYTASFITTFSLNCEACLIISRNYAIDTTLSLTGSGPTGLSYVCLQVNDVEVYHENLIRECKYFSRDTLNGYDDFCIASPYTLVRGSYRACICITNACNFDYTRCLRQINPILNEKIPLFTNTVVKLTDPVRCYQPYEDATQQTSSSLRPLCADDDDACRTYLFHQGVLCAISIDRTNKTTRQALIPSIYSSYLIKYKTQLCKAYTWTSKSISFSQCELNDTVCMCAFDQCNKDLQTCRTNRGICNDYYFVLFLFVVILNVTI